ncbi:MAG: Hsp20/alpha crystallin family protein [Rhodopseudomonas sp.]|uniref:Hsp20/alpha crystallin family protein n=1 Tax=Rhodopseudomonas sp. TaxID=1078 RepID=UPI0018228465|nr:Hsp20/alpha crystallin family protein [Rhodopseudomonas sp.]NVN88050.1 Hsp20/alpha crystallin family protein [Rhodopseudomonas sp.]
MAEAATKLPVKTEEKKVDQAATAVQAWRPLEGLRREVDRLFEDFDRGSWLSPFRRSPFDIEPLWGRGLKLTATPAVDIVENDSAYKVTAELPGMDEKNFEVKLDNGGLTIKGEKQEEKEEKQNGYHLQERRFGSFERYFAIPEGVDADKIEASFKKGILTVTLPKKPDAKKPAKKIDVKVA